MAALSRSFKIRVPATSANIGPGFDVVGIPLFLYLTLSVAIPIPNPYESRSNPSAAAERPSILYTGWRDLVPSFLTQLSTQSSVCCDILSRLYSDHGNDAQQPNDDALKRCLIEMLTAQDHRPIYLIMDDLDECPDTSEVPSQELVSLQIPNLRTCVTSRPKFDIRDFLEPLTSRQMSSIIKADKNKILPIMLGPLFTQYQNRTCGDGGRKIKNMLSRHSLDEPTGCK